jgi:hypothetical protein
MEEEQINCGSAKEEVLPHLIEFANSNVGGLKGSAYPRHMNFSCTPGFACGEGIAMNTTANFSNLAWADMAHAGWIARVIARKGDNAQVIFTAPGWNSTTRFSEWSERGSVFTRHPHESFCVLSKIQEHSLGRARPPWRSTESANGFPP